MILLVMLRECEEYNQGERERGERNSLVLHTMARFGANLESERCGGKHTYRKTSAPFTLEES